jgi:hypothetical protein
MRRFLIALTILSFVLMSQSVLAVVPAPTLPVAQAERLAEVWGAAEGAETAGSDALVISTTPEPAAIFLLMTGLFGLVVVGNRSPVEPTPRRR